MISWNEIEEETEVEVEDILEKRRIKVELGKEIEVETEADKEFDSCIVGDTLRQQFKQIRINGSEIEIKWLDWVRGGDGCNGNSKVKDGE